MKKQQACQLLCGREPGTRSVAGFLIGEACYGRLQLIAEENDAGVLGAVRVEPRAAFWKDSRRPAAKPPSPKTPKAPARAGASRARLAPTERPCVGCQRPFRPKGGPGRPPLYGPCCPAAKRPTHLSRAQRRRTA